MEQRGARPNCSAPHAPGRSRAMWGVSESAIVRDVPSDDRLRSADPIRLTDHSDRVGGSRPANWHPGEDVVLGAPRTQVELDARPADDSVKLTDWYLATKPGTPG